jgi:predicted nucleic acid-binding protein
MAEVVIDACALVETFVGAAPDPDLRKRVRASALYAPEVLALEVLDVLHRLVRRGLVDEQQADRVVHWLTQAPIAEHTHRPLIPRIWELRHSIRPYDGAYIAVAEELDLPLVTCDAKLAGSNSHTAEIEIYPSS